MILCFLQGHDDTYYLMNIHGRLNDLTYLYKTRSTPMWSTSCVVSLKNGDECDSFHCIATVREK